MKFHIFTLHKPTVMNVLDCHRLPNRSYFFNGRQFPICARCLGLYIGYLAMPIFAFGFLQFPLYLSLFIILPTILDWWIQKLLSSESTNGIRLWTGIFAGIGISSLVAIIGQGIGLIILDTIKTIL